MAIEGRYSGQQFAHVPLAKEYDEWTRIHEEAHRFLTQSTPWGHMIVFLTDLAEVDLNEERSQKYYPSICKVLFQASEFVQENYAILSTVHQARLQQNQDIIDLTLNDDYARILCRKYLDVYMQITPSEKAFEICEYLARVAMETHLLHISPEHWKSSDTLFQYIFKNRASYHPDFRFNRLVEKLNEGLPRLPDQDWYSFIEQLAAQAGLEVCFMTEADHQNSLVEFKQMIAAVWGESETLQNALKLFSQRIKTEDCDQRIKVANNFEIPEFASNYDFFQFDGKIFFLINLFDVLRIFPYESKIGLQYIQNRVARQTYVEVGWRNIKSFIDFYPNQIIIPYIDCQTFAEHDLDLQNRRIFYYAECHQSAFSDCLVSMNAQEKPYIHFRQVNDSTFGVFVQVQKNQILFCFQKKQAFKLFVKDVQDGKYSHVSCDESMIDNVFCNKKDDEHAYRDVVQAMTQIETSAKRIELDFEFE